VCQLPLVTKPELMEHFDQMITDPEVRKAELDAYVADKSNIGKPYLGKYMAWTTSGTTGIPDISLEDKNWDTQVWSEFKN
jgi:hypothetical protein